MWTITFDNGIGKVTNDQGLFEKTYATKGAAEKAAREFAVLTVVLWNPKGLPVVELVRNTATAVRVKGKDVFPRTPKALPVWQSPAL